MVIAASVAPYSLAVNAVVAIRLPIFQAHEAYRIPYLDAGLSSKVDTKGLCVKYVCSGLGASKVEYDNALVVCTTIEQKNSGPLRGLPGAAISPPERLKGGGVGV